MLQQRQVAHIVQQVKRVQHCLGAFAPEVRRAVLSANHDLAVDQERVSLKASGGFDNGRENGQPRCRCG